MEITVIAFERGGVKKKKEKRKEKGRKKKEKKKKWGCTLDTEPGGTV